MIPLRRAAKVMGRQEGPEDTDGQALALRHPDTIQEALSTRRRAPRAIFPRAREAARATTVWEEQQRTVKAAVKDAPVQEGAVRDRVRRMVAAAKEKMRRDAGSGERGQEKDGGDVSGLRLEEQSRGQAKRVGVFTRKFGLGYMHAANRDVIRSLIE